MLEKAVIREWCRNNRCKPRFYGDNPSIVILGEHHGVQGNRQQQESIIELVGPEYLLHELFDGKIYNPATKELGYLSGVAVDPKVEKLTPRSHYEELIGMAEKHGCILVGMDLSFAELELIRDRISDEHPKSTLDQKLQKEYGYREKRMGERMVEYHHKTDRPIVAVMGGDHRRPKSEIHAILQNEGISYVCISQPGR